MQETFDSTGYNLEDRGARWIEGFAFLKPGVTRQQAQAELNSIAKRLENNFPETNRGHGIQLLPLWQTPFNGASAMSHTLGITMVVVFLCCSSHARTSAICCSRDRCYGDMK